MYDPLIRFNATVNKALVPVTRRMSSIYGYSEVRDREGNLYSITIDTASLEIDPRTGNVINKTFYLELEEAELFLETFNSY